MLTILVFFAGLDSDEYSGMFFVCIVNLFSV